ncbi:WD repeat-containing protein 60 [Nibea albiflora]|uniref:WD repeat-containing protein 60 n=1 Tax=Nibea albiflora TaxID=240163 RepID=A0ACB7F4T2_NIBAL|nr:WD repeat-containing protein 60 [Nibea albiflora]
MRAKMKMREEEKEPQHPEVREEKEELTPQRRKEIEAIQRAMDEENERVGTAQTRRITNREEEDEPKWSSRGSEKNESRSSQRGKFIDFVAAKQREVSKKVATKQKKRSTELLRLIDLDFSLTFSLLDLPPVNEYDMYIRNFGTTNTKQVMVVLLEEDQAERKSQRKLRSQTDTLSFSDGSLQLNTKLPFLYGRSTSLVHFSQVQRHTMMSVHGPTAKPSAVRLDSCTIICIWNIWEPSRPQKVLVYESEVQCCCFSPGKAILVFAGTSVGSVVLWDLREHSSNHYRLKIGEDEWTLRQPTFSTESSGLSFQLASLDESGVLNFWVVVELPKANEAGSATDLGLRPGGKVKLLHSSSLLTAERASPRNAAKTGPLQTLHLKFLPTDSNHFFIGTNMVGCGDGTIRLHAVSHEQPVAEWKNGTAGEPVVALQVAAMAVFGDSGQQNTYSGIALARESGTIEIQYFARHFTVPVIEEEEKLERMMTEAF